MIPGLRCEWAKSKARAARWAEEVQLLVEEMRRVIAYLDWKAKWWREQGDARLGELEADIADGVSAYAAKQAHIYTSMARSFAATWYHVLLANGLPIEWPRLYNPIIPIAVHSDSDSDRE